ncbi:MAG: flagellar hook-basal body complex protein FliE [Sulfitobacter sp.]|jgi:flagellar hook-basal body complex protein FliE|uniref:flagellar hook-basal body complex protein FliE n=1 Tax=Sulfitobacter sp. TaxID=1903071 RepID=UPI000C677738|nr:flagellar basal body protein [Roseobacter sp.]MBV50409.1 flagellar basal body protein [Roseobacter sp.]THF72509.1 MAG: flagellar basal body protein [Sulfitobacter sp. SK025]|tara:strand:+ start:18310 stop:18630 length:321 start_codon:yes stop_codon:yes gene_type:complete
MTDFSAVRSSYVQAAYAKTVKGEARTDAGAAATAPKDFSSMVGQAAANAVESVREGDSMAIKGLTGQASLQQVVQATMEMEQTVQVSVALRDKLVEAYQDIIRMPV